MSVLMRKKQSIDDVNLDKEEQELLDSIEKGEWKSVKNLAQTKKKAKKIAANTLRKDARISIRISSGDLDRIKQIAAYEGLTYQTYIASLLHKLSAGHLNSTP